jgi:hypothetical protein
MADFAIVGSDLPEAGCGPQICLDKSNGRTKHAIKSSFFWFFCEWLKAKRLHRRCEAFIARLRVLSMRRYALTLMHVIPGHAHFCTGQHRRTKRYSKIEGVPCIVADVPIVLSWVLDL